MVAPKLPSSHNKRKRRRKHAEPNVDNRILMIPLGLAFLAVSSQILRLFRSLVKPRGKAPVLRREHASETSWNYDWCQSSSKAEEEERECVLVLPIDLADFLPPLPDDPLMDMLPDPGDLFGMDDGENSQESNKGSNSTNSMTDDLDNHLDRLGNFLMNPSTFLYPPTPKILVEARRNFTRSGYHGIRNHHNHNITHQSFSVRHHSGDHFALISRRGLGGTHENNQDRALLVDLFPTSLGRKHKHKKHPKKRHNPLHNNFFMGIFDGHGLSGHLKADFAAATLPGLLLDRLIPLETRLDNTMDEQIRQALQSSFWDIHRQGPLIHDSGCTASTVVRLGRRLYFANTGDSRSMLVQIDMERRHVNITHVTTPHKPDLPEERQRIVKTGCIVIDPIPFYDSTARVAEPIDKEGGSGLALAMSRSLGDYDLEHCGVIPEPTVTVVELPSSSGSLAAHDDNQHDNDSKILLAVSLTDGMFDYVPLEEIAQGLSRPYLNRNTYLGTLASPLELAVEDLVRTASDRWLVNTTGIPYRDDITIAVRRVH
ncbi:protein phosphatase 2C 73 [Seminavis robusta]|uniref:Protein phosphatase 2C 73 n=1 Tax=Seminavis robusta TaxID=568900 RepID=A0A9N8DAZ3_9STRA|nr:protein phosphatase 2C 73 [Seminavis robusta]|eukprot:Sro4_g003740.1 protein phosphatase 2C 73 (542) ;mRNA; r:232246-233871